MSDVDPDVWEFPQFGEEDWFRKGFLTTAEFDEATPGQVPVVGSDFRLTWANRSSGGGGGGGGSGYTPENATVSPQMVSSDLPVGSSAAFDAPDITTAMTGRIMAVHVASAAPCRVDVELVSGSRTIIDTYYFGTGEDGWWYPPYPTFWELIGDGVAHFGCTVTNLGGKEASDVRTTIYWDEVT